MAAVESMLAQAGWYYERWHFQRLDDGSVRVRASVDTSTEEILIPPAHWASIVASVSWAGRTPDRQARAVRFHGEPDESKETEDADG